MATDIIARGMAAGVKKSVTELGNKIESEKWIGTKAEWEAVDKSTIKDGTIVYITDDETVVLYDKAEMEKIAAKVAADRTAAETAAQTAQAVADSLPDDYTTAVGKIAENTAEIGRVKLTDKELQRRVNALYDMGQGITHKFETDSDTAYAKTVPTGGKLMSVKSVGGRSIVWNQIFEAYSGTNNGVTVTTEADGTITLNGTAESSYIYFKPLSPAQNKVGKYILKLLILNNPDSVTMRYAYFNRTITTPAVDKGTASALVNQTATDIGLQKVAGLSGFTVGTVFNSVKIKIQVFDLTQMFGAGNEPTSVEEFEKMFPNDYYPYNEGEVINSGTAEVVEQGKNLWDEVWEEGSIDSATGMDIPAPTVIRSKNYTPIIPKSTYIFAYAGSTAFENVKTRFYDIGKKYIGYNDNNAQTVRPNGAFVTPVNAAYVRFTLPPEYGNVYKNDIALIAGSSGDYTPYHRNEYPIPEAIKSLPGYGWSAGTARNYVDYENKRYVQCVGSVDLGTLNWELNTTSAVENHFYGYVKHLNFKYLGAFGTTVYNALCSKYMTVARNSHAFVDKTLAVDGVTMVSQIQVKDTAYPDVATFKQAMQGVMLYYELATPIVTDISTLIDDDFLRNIEVEALGSVTFKNSNGDSYRIPVPSELEYIVKLSEVGGTI